MGKRSGHYCYGCGRHRANEKFSGKGHRNHICKDCKRAGIDKKSEDRPSQTSAVSYRKSIRARLIVFTDKEGYFFFDIGKNIYAVKTSLNSPIYRYQNTTEPKFVIANKLMADIEQVIEALFIKYYNKLDEGHYYDYYDVLVNEEWNLSQKDLEYLNWVTILESSILIGEDE